LPCVQLMVEAKVNMIRDAQCTEKKVIKKEVDAEEKRLDDAMEIDRVNAIRMEEEIARKRKNERMIGAMMIMDQIKHNEQVCARASSRRYLRTQFSSRKNICGICCSPRQSMVNSLMDSHKAAR